MTTKGANSNAYARKWAKASASVLLTSRDDISIGEVLTDSRLDFIATIGNCPRPGVMQFGVIVDAIAQTRSDEEIVELMGRKVRTLAKLAPYRDPYTQLETFPLPTLLFFYEATNARAWFTWVFKPYGRELKPQSVVVPETLDEAVLDLIVEAVNNRAEALFPAQASITPAISNNGRR